ncbi:MAG: hypothetical protein GEV11_12405 [Streptosporangiales bacterium]|nr:hypothetical protein [Streptosporangiales bacterium]
MMAGFGAPWRNADHVVFGMGTEGAIELAERHGENASVIGRAMLPLREHRGGKPLPDPDGRAARLVDTFSRRDFPGTAPRIDSDGTVAPPT